MRFGNLDLDRNTLQQASLIHAAAGGLIQMFAYSTELIEHQTDTESRRECGFCRQYEICLEIVL